MPILCPFCFIRVEPKPTVRVFAFYSRFEPYEVKLVAAFGHLVSLRILRSILANNSNQENQLIQKRLKRGDYGKTPPGAVCPDPIEEADRSHSRTAESAIKRKPSFREDHLSDGDLSNHICVARRKNVSTGHISRTMLEPILRYTVHEFVARDARPEFRVCAAAPFYVVRTTCSLSAWLVLRRTLRWSVILKRSK